MAIARSLLVAGLLALVALGWPPAAKGAQAYPDQPLVAAQSARAFGDSVGVNVHLSWLDTSYGNFDGLQSRLRELGVRYVRDGLCASCPYHIDRLRRLAAAGIGAHIIAGSLSGGAAEMEANLKAIREQLGGAVISVGAPNEPNLQGVSPWIEPTRAYQRSLYAAVKGHPASAHLPVLGPAVAYPASPPELGDLSAYLDRGNSHPYPGGGPPLYNIDEQRLLATAVSGNKPLVATEAGYHTDATQVGHPHASERAIGIYMPRLALEGYRAGMERTYVYQLADPWTEAERSARGVSIMENSFGLLRSDLQPKPSFLALRNLLRAVDAGSAPVATPGGLRFGLEGAPPDARSLLLRSADGAYALVLWRGVSVWDRDARQDLFPTPDGLEVVLGEPVALAQRFDPVDSDAETARWSGPQRIPVELAGAPVVLRLTPPGVVPGGDGAPASRPDLRKTKKRQRLRRHVLIRVACTSPCASAAARGKLVVKRKRTRTFKLTRARKAARAGMVTLRLKIRRKARRAASRALKRGGRVRARVVVTTRTATGASLGTARKTIVLYRKRAR